MKLLHDAWKLEREQAEEDHAEHGGDDLLPLLLRLERIDCLLRHQGAPVADAPVAAGSLGVVVVVADVVVVVLVVSVVVVGVATRGGGEPEPYTNASITSDAWICGKCNGLSLNVS